jgi:molybdopterin-synthase adenylyltransferase
LEEAGRLLSKDEKERYGRQMVLPRWGERGQARLKESVVFVAGAGGLGSPVILYLAASGVGRIRVCDDGSVEGSNLNRQILYTDADIGESKCDAVTRAIARINPHVSVDPFPDRIADGNVETLVGDSCLILDCLDNFEARYTLNAFSVRRGVPMIHAGVSGMCGQVSFIHPPDTSCLACMVPVTVPEVASARGEPVKPVTPGGVFPVVGAAAGVVGSLQALEALKHLTGIGSSISGRMLFYDGQNCTFHLSRERKNPRCRVCSGLR